MCKFLEWFLLVYLKMAGYPRRKGIRRREYVDTGVVNACVETGLTMLMGIGAGRPQTALRLLVATFDNNPWTVDSTADLFDLLSKDSDTLVRGSGVLPWEAIANNIRIAPYDTDLLWSEYLDDELLYRRGAAAALALFWGFTHPVLVHGAFELWKEDYERSARMYKQYGLDVTESSGLDSIDDFYQYCEGFAVRFGKVEALPSEIPPEVLARPEAASRVRQA